MYLQVSIQAPEQGDGWQIELHNETGGALLAPDGQPFLPQPRKIERSPQGYPLPPDGFPAGLQASQLPGVHANLLERSGGQVNLAQFGLYLLNVLFGKALWNQILTTAGAEPLELALAFPPGDTLLNQLPWEALASSDTRDGFLASLPDVAITRRAPTRQPGSPGLEMISPPKVLFVIGASLTDPVIRPGSEYLGLLRSLNGDPLTGDDPLYLDTRVLIAATLESLKNAVLSFRPSVIHFTCHGGINDKGESVLLLRSPQNSRQDVKVTVEDLLTAIRIDALPQPILPQVVLLNACSTAAGAEIRVGRPLASALVYHGVPVVIGMSGQISDQACRLFTRAFYTALLKGGDIAAAAARGRRAAINFHDSYDPLTTPDWAMPTLFLAEGFGPARLKLQPAPVQNARQRQALQFSGRPDYPVFCGRWEIFTALTSLMEGKVNLALAITTEQDSADQSQKRQFGRSRLLQELAAQALRDGHVPVLMSVRWLNLSKRTYDNDRFPNEKWPKDFKDFLMVLAGVVSETISILGDIPEMESLRAWEWTNLALFLEAWPNLPPAADLKPAYKKLGSTPIQNLAMALTDDLLSLLKQVNDLTPAAERKPARLLLLFDDAHDMIFINQFLTLLGPNGFQHPSARDQIRVVLTYSTKSLDGQSDTIKALENWANAYNILTLPLGPLHRPIPLKKSSEVDDLYSTDGLDPSDEKYQEAVLVYQNLLLNWRIKTKEPKTRTPLTLVSPTRDMDDVEVIRVLLKNVEGMPGKFEDPELGDKIVDLARSHRKTLLLANDEAILNNLDKISKKRGGGL